MINDPVGDLLTRIRNAVQSRTVEVSMPYSRLKEDVAQTLKREGYLEEVKKEEHDLIIVLAFMRRKPLITGVRNTSKPGLRIYRKADKLPYPLGGSGVSIISTPKGVMSNREARKLGIGGEVLGEIW